MREYAVKRGWTIAVQIKEVGSGAAQREMRETLLASARRREIDVVLVWRLDRWGRSVADLVSTLQELQHLGVGFVSLTEALDLTTPAGRAMAGLLAVFAEFERDILGERVRAGLANARLNGKRLGRPAVRPSRGPWAWLDPTPPLMIRSQHQDAPVLPSSKPDPPRTGPIDPIATPARHRFHVVMQKRVMFRASRVAPRRNQPHLICTAMVHPRLTAYSRMVRICSGRVC